jgi:hypothetical protein
VVRGALRGGRRRRGAARVRSRGHGLAPRRLLPRYGTSRPLLRRAPSPTRRRDGRRQRRGRGRVVPSRCLGSSPGVQFFLREPQEYSSAYS